MLNGFQLSLTRRRLSGPLVRQHGADQREPAAEPIQKTPRTTCAELRQQPGVRAGNLSWRCFLSLAKWVVLSLIYGLTNPNGLSASQQTAALASAADPADDAIEFTTGILPILTKSGCNSGACHGAAAGRGEFRLSLFGSTPAADHFAIVRHLNSRRVNFASAGKSLLILKPTGDVDHAGGIRFAASSAEADRILHWIKSGAPFGSGRRAVSLKSVPESVVIETGETASIRYLVQLSDGSEIDVSNDVAVSNPNSDALRLETEPAGGVTLTPNRSGRHLLTVRYPGVVASTEILVPWKDLTSAERSALPETDPPSEIDRMMARRFTQMRIVPTPPVEDTQFIHRTSLLLTGRRPLWKDTEAFLSSSDTDKRSRLVEQLLNSPEFLDYWAWQMARQFRTSQARSDKIQSGWHAWIRQALQQDIGVFQMIQQMIAANGNPEDQPAAAFYTVARDARQQTEYFSEAFLGLRLRCANCHDHPLDRWTQEDYHGLAAIFARVGRDPVVSDLPRGININPATGQPAAAKLLLSSPIPDSTNSRQQLGEWIRKDGSELIAAHFVNTVWRQLMGQGLVEPSDDHRSTNPPVHPDIARHLATQFAQSGGQLRPLIREICLTLAFQRSAAMNTRHPGEQFGSSRQPIPLPPEILLDQLTQITQSPDAQLEPNQRSICSMVSKEDLATLRTQSGCSNGCLAESPAESLSLALEMINGRVFNERIQPDSVIVQKLAGLAADPTLMFRRMYEWTLSRQPNASEIDFWMKQMTRSKAERSADDMSDFLTDAIWTLVTSSEFRCAP